MDNTSQLQAPQTFQLPNMQGAANNAFNQIGGLNTFGNLGTGILPQAQHTAQNLYNNPYSGQALGGAQGASQLGQAAAYGGFGAGASLVPYAQNILQTGFDPQQQLYNRTLQQVQDQSNVNNAMAGVATTPYGAGLANQATNNFNIDWQNQQLGRQSQAAGAAGQLAQTGVGLMNQAPSTLSQSSMLPYATYSDIGQGQNQALSQLLGLGGQGQGLAQAPIQDYLSYLGIGNQANQVQNQNFQNQLAQQNQAWNQQGQFAGGIGSILGWNPNSPGNAGSIGSGLFNTFSSFLPI